MSQSTLLPTSFPLDYLRIAFMFSWYGFMAVVVSRLVWGILRTPISHIFAFGIHSLSKYFENVVATSMECFKELYDSFAQSKMFQFLGTSSGPTGRHLSSEVFDRYISYPMEWRTTALVNMSRTLAHACFIHARRIGHKHRKSSILSQTFLYNPFAISITLVGV